MMENTSEKPNDGKRSIPKKKYITKRSKAICLSQLTLFKNALGSIVKNIENDCSEYMIFKDEVKIYNKKYKNMVKLNKLISMKNCVLNEMLKKNYGHVRSFEVKYLFRDYKLIKDYSYRVREELMEIEFKSDNNKFEDLKLESQDGSIEESSNNHFQKLPQCVDVDVEIEKIQIFISEITKNYEENFMSLVVECDNYDQWMEFREIAKRNFRIFTRTIGRTRNGMQDSGGFWIEYATKSYDYSLVMQNQLNVELNIICSVDAGKLLVNYDKLKDIIDEQIKNYEFDIQMLREMFDNLNKNVLCGFVGENISYKFAEEWAIYCEYHNLLANQCDDEDMREKLQNHQGFLDINYSFLFDKCDNETIKRLLEIENKLMYNKGFEDYICCMKICSKRMSWLEEVMEIDRRRLEDVKSVIKKLRKIK